MKRTALCLVFVVGAGISANAQWPSFPAPGLTRTADGRVDLAAPPPRVDGKPDLSGLWRPRPDPLGKVEGVENTVFPRYMENVAIDTNRDPLAVLRPEYVDLVRPRLEPLGLHDPINRCAPPGALRLLSLPPPMKIVHARGLVLLLHEKETTFRQIFMDGRELPTDPHPTFMGYSIGRWDGDTLVVTSSGFTDQGWLDGAGHPQSESLRMTERYRRTDTGHLQVEITVTDPKVLKAPITATQHFLLIPDGELIEYYCTENEKDVPHYTK
jgi:hypothetical protein